MTDVAESSQAQSSPQAEQTGRYDAFLSYSRSDRETAQRLGATLEAQGKDIWVDVEDILGGADWHARIKRGIEACKAFVFLLSPASLSSAHCREELELAVALNKLVIPVVHRDVDEHTIPRLLGDREWVFLRDGDGYEVGVAKLVEALETDLEWRDQHTRLAGRTREWLDSDGDKSFLLRGSDLREAELWLSGQRDHRESATAEQAEYILASRRAAVVRQRTLLSVVGAGLAIAVALAIFALIQRNVAIEQKREALSRGLIAQSQAELARDPSLAGALSIEAYRTKPTIEARNAMLTLLAGLRRFRGPVGDHGGSVSAVAFSPDGETLATAAADGLLRLWRVATRERLGALVAVHDGEVLDVAFSPDGAMLASAGGDGAVRLWDVRNRKQVAMIRAHDRRGVSAVAFSRDGTLLASAGADHVVRLWDAASGRARGRFPGHQGAVEDIAFDRRGTTLASGSLDGTVRLWDVARRRRPRVLPGGDEQVHSVAFSRDGRTLASGGAAGTVRLWDSKSGRPDGAFACQRGAVLSVAFDGRGRLACGGADGTLRLWDVAGRDALGPLMAGHTRAVRAIAFSGDGRRLASAGADRTVRLWDVAHDGSLYGALHGHRRGAMAVAFSRDAATLASAARDGTVALWDVPSRSRLRELRGDDGPVNGLALSSDDALLASASEGGTVELWDLARAGARPRTLLDREGAVYGLAFDSGGRALASAAADGLVRLWDPLARRSPVLLSRHRRSVTAVDFDPRGRTLASASLDGSVRLWDTGRRRLLGELGHHGVSVFDVAFSSDGATLAAALRDGTVQLWDVARRKVKGAPLPTGADTALSVAFSPDGSTLAVAGHDGRVWLWDVRERRSLGSPLDRHGDDVNGVAFSGDGSLLASASLDGSVRLWSSLLWSDGDAHGGKLERAICARVWRSLSKAEWQALLPDEPQREICPPSG